MISEVADPFGGSPTAAETVFGGVIWNFFIQRGLVLVGVIG